MYKLSVPIMATTVTRENRARYAELCKEAGAERIFLAVGDLMQKAPQNLKENVGFFKEQGFEVGIWSDTLGHGAVFSHVETPKALFPFARTMDFNGKVFDHSYCPLDSQFIRYASEKMVSYAETGADIIMLDDDFRLSHFGEGLSCCCPLHMERISALLGEPCSREQLRPYLTSGKENKYRSAWLKAKNESMQEFASALREAVSKNHPQTRICICTAAVIWNVDGIDIEKVTRTFAGENPPLIRLCGAPYWAAKKRHYPLPAVFEIARLFSSFLDERGIERMAEGDVYPRPRYTCPASFLELYDLMIRIDGGYEGILKYMFDYVAGPDFELGYLKHHQISRPLHQKLPEFFQKGANVGVRIHAYPHTMEKADLDLITPPNVYTPRPADGTMLGANGIPTLYRGKGFCNSVFGENAREYDLSLLKEGTILDATSAVLLSERGVDIGLSQIEPLETKTIAFIYAKDPARKSLVTNGEARILAPHLKEGCEVELYYSEPKGATPLAYRYENEKGERFLVFLFEGDSIMRPDGVCHSGLLLSPSVQDVLISALPWISKAPLPAYCAGNPELYLMAEQTDEALSLALFNCFADPALEPVIQLGEPYQTARFLNCKGTLKGDQILLEDIPPYGFCAIEVCK